MGKPLYVILDRPILGLRQKGPTCGLIAIKLAKDLLNTREGVVSGVQESDPLGEKGKDSADLGSCSPQVDDLLGVL